jgi:hypothetical protein
MCHAWEYESIKKAYAEEMERRRKEEAARSQAAPASLPQSKPAQPQPRVRDKEPAAV